MAGSSDAERDAVTASRARISSSGGVWHRVLQVRVSATREEVQKAYRSLALLHHPDKNPANREEDTFKKVQLAYKQALVRCSYNSHSSTTTAATAAAQRTPAKARAAKVRAAGPKASAKKSASTVTAKRAARQNSTPNSSPTQPAAASNAWYQHRQSEKPVDPTNRPAPKSSVRDPSWANLGQRADPAGAQQQHAKPAEPAKRPAPKNFYGEPAWATEQPPERVHTPDRLRGQFARNSERAAKARKRTTPVIHVPTPSAPMPCAQKEAIEAAKHGDQKALCLQKLLGLQLDDKTSSSSPAPHVPANGRFTGVKEYALTWGEAILTELEAQAFGEALRAKASISSSSPSSYAPLLGEFVFGSGWCLQPVTGFWATREERDRGGLHIYAKRGGQYWMSNGDGSLTSSLTLMSGGVDRWVVGSFGSREIRVRCSDWNTLEVKNGGLVSRAPEPLREESIVLISNPNQPAASLARFGVVTRRYGRALVRAASDAYNDLSEAEIRILKLGLVSHVRELNAVKGVGSVRQPLLNELLGHAPPREGQCSLRRQHDRGPLPCLQKLNSSQVHAVETAGSRDAGFTLLWGPPGTGKSATLMSLVNALHVQEYERLHKAIENLVLGIVEGVSDDAQWHAAVKLAPRILVAASSNAAVEGLIQNVEKNKLLDRQGNTYEPWGMIRVGTDRGKLRIDLDTRVNELLNLQFAEIQEKSEEARSDLNSLQQKVLSLRNEIRMLQSVLPLPVGWEARISRERSDLIEFHDHRNKIATHQRPPLPLDGEPSVHLFNLPHAVKRLQALISCADRWWQLQGEEQRFRILTMYHKMKAEGEDRSFTPQDLRQDLESSLLGSAQVVFATLSSTARLLPRDGIGSVKSFGAVIIDEAAQATEPSTLVPIQLARSLRCVLVGDDRQLPPTVFAPQAEQNLTARSLFERLRALGHRAELLGLQYRMSPQISAFPRTYFYGGALRNAPGVAHRTSCRLHRICPPLLFVDLASSSAQRAESGSWRNWEEARVCAKILAHLCAKAKSMGEADLARDAGAITGYRAQQEAVRLEVRRGGAPVQSDAIRTVDGYQGGESSIIVLSAVRAPEDVCSKRRGTLGFLSDERRLNVALTRAKSILVVVGHAPTLVEAPAWAAFLAHVRSNSSCYQQLASSSEMQRLWSALEPDVVIL